MNERPYMSIGDVLGLLREEFPDITISKIRFLESRGLLVPERTPSGYRKFYDHDVERLRWILRQQREHFLPLKVIKGRLEGNDPSSERQPLFEVAASESEGSPELAPEPVTAPVTEHVATGPIPAAAVAAAAGGEPVVGRRNGNVGVVERAVETETVAEDREEDLAVAVTAAAAGSGSGPGSGSGSPARHRPGRGSGTGSPAAPAAPAPAAAVVEDAVTSPPSGEGAGRSGGGGSEPSHDKTPPPLPDRPGATGTTLTVSELAHASGLAVDKVEELESFGLICGRTVAGVHCYDEEALAVASIAAGFDRFGIEARHLRMFKHAAERQAGLFSQVVLPMLRQRNPEARRRAIADLARLSELGAAMQAAFLKSSLDDLTGG